MPSFAAAIQTVMQRMKQRLAQVEPLNPMADDESIERAAREHGPIAQALENDLFQLKALFTSVTVTLPALEKKLGLAPRPQPTAVEREILATAARVVDVVTTFRVGRGNLALLAERPTSREWEQLWRELDRRLAAVVSAEPIRVSAAAENSETKPPTSPAPSTSHSEDFSSVNWFGSQYTFNPTQARCVASLWREWDKGGLALNQRTIGEEVGSTSDSYRLVHTFRDHPAWGVMIVQVGEGLFKLARPNDSK
jgi:hypothetical protein